MIEIPEPGDDTVSALRPMHSNRLAGHDGVHGMNELVFLTLAGAADLLRRTDWCRDTSIDEDSRRCVTRALFESAGQVWSQATANQRHQYELTCADLFCGNDYNLYLTAATRVAQTLNLSHWPFGSSGEALVKWNDEVAVDREHVITVLEKAAWHD